MQSSATVVMLVSIASQMDLKIIVGSIKVGSFGLGMIVLVPISRRKKKNNF